MDKKRYMSYKTNGSLLGRMECMEQQKQMLIDAAGDAFRSIIPQFREKGYTLVEYNESITLFGLACLKTTLLAFDPRKLEKKMATLFDGWIGGPPELSDDVESVEDVMSKLGLITMQEAHEDGEMYPEFVVMRNIPLDDLQNSFERAVDGELSPEQLVFGGLLSGEAPPVAIEATSLQVVEVRDKNLLEDVEHAVKIWGENLEKLFEEGKISVFLKPRIILV